MGAPTSNRKRRGGGGGGDYLFLNHKFPFSISPPQWETHISKKPKTSPSPSPSSPSSSIMQSSDENSSKSDAWRRVHQYPEPVNPIRRQVHAPCRVSKLGFPESSNRGSRPKEDYDDERGNFLSNQCDYLKNVAINSFRYFNKDREEKQVIDVVVDDETDKDDEQSDDLRIAEVEVVEDGREWRSVGWEQRSQETSGVEPNLVQLDGKVVDGNLQPFSSPVVSDLKNADLRMESPLLHRESGALGVPVHKKLLESAERRNPKLFSLSSAIKVTERILSTFWLLRPVKKPEDEAVLQDVLREPFVPLTEEEGAEVSWALSNSSRRKVLATHENSNIEITGERLQCLKPGAWLNDEVINLYLELLKEREKREPKKFLKCHFFNTFFYKKLISGSGYDFKSVKRWTSQRKLGYCLLECDKIFVPIHKQNHWCLAVINNKDKKFQYLDSLKGIDTQVLNVLARYFLDEVKDKSGKDIDFRSWKQEYVDDLPEQKNGWDCGVFMIKYADFYSRGLGLCFKQEDMPYFRQRTAKEILRLKAE